MKYKIRKGFVGFFLVDEQDFKDIVEYLRSKAKSFGYKKVCSNEEYVEFEPKALEDRVVPHIGDVREFNVDIIQIWTKKEDK